MFVKSRCEAKMLNTHNPLCLGHLEKMSALHDSQMYEVNRRLEALEQTLNKIHGTDVSDKLESVLSLVKEGAEGNT